MIGSGRIGLEAEVATPAKPRYLRRSPAGFRTHRLRDTFAVEVLLAGVAIEDVSALLGHRSIRVKERRYAPWNSARLDRPVAILQKVNARDEMLKELSFVVKQTAVTPEGSDR